MKIYALNVTNGVYWVKVPELDLRILCGAPADIVKHLIKKGFIKTMQANGVTFETGPNAILLSDSMVQNSCFSNLAEFPVLQMLYRQGMLIPNHPNNNGTKPLLIGDKKQIDIQMKYIFSGNYGIGSVEKMCESGLDKKLAENVMRMKMKFAFGQMRDSHELLDSVTVNEDEKTTIKEGLTIQRISHNKFEFEYQGEKVIVDLNLKKDQSYLPSYQLCFSQINREYFSIIHTGEGNGWNMEKPCMGSIITYHGKIYLIDTGPFILETLYALGIGTNEIEGIFQTHVHDDHFAGITTLLQNNHKIKYYCSSIVKLSAMNKLSILLDIEPENLNIFFDFIELELDEWVLLDGLEVKTSLSPHPIETNIFYFRTMGEDGFKSYAHLADIASFHVLDNMVTEDKSSFGISQKYCDQVKALYLEYADVKKVDIGGGMIHGEARDFKNDPSKKLLLSHFTDELSIDDKVIGSGAAFGSVDNLIPSRQNYDYRHAHKFLQNHFINISRSGLEILLNCEIITLNPNSIIAKQNDKITDIYLIITGNIEAIDETNINSSTFSSGTIIGELQGLLDQSYPCTLRTLGYVKVLKIPITIYLNFVIQNNVFEHLETLHDKLSLLNQNKLFGELITSQNLEKISNSMVKVTVDSIDETLLEQRKLYIIENGEVEVYKDGKYHKTLKKGCHINSKLLTFGKIKNYTYKTKQKVSLYSIDIVTFSNIPVIFWKLYLYRL